MTIASKRIKFQNYQIKVLNKKKAIQNEPRTKRI